MGCVETELLASLFLLPDTIAVEAVYPTKTHLTVRVACVLKNAACPLCEHLSERIHGRYGRTVADVPCGGRRVTLALTVRKFVCCTPECPRKIFTERLRSILPHRPSPFLHRYLPSPAFPAAYLQHAPPGSLSAKQESLMRSKHSTSDSFEPDTLTWRRLTN